MAKPYSSLSALSSSSSMLRLLSTSSCSQGRQLLPTSFKSVRLTPNAINKIVRIEQEREERRNRAQFVRDPLDVAVEDARKRANFFRSILAHVAKVMAGEESLAERIRGRGLNLTKAELTKDKTKIEIFYIVSSSFTNDNDNDNTENNNNCNYEDDIQSVLDELAGDVRQMLMNEHGIGDLPCFTFVEDLDYLARPKLDEQYSEIERTLSEAQKSKQERVEELKTSVLQMAKKTDSLGLDHRQVLDSLWDDLEASRSCTELRTRRDPAASPNIYPSYHATVLDNEDDDNNVVKFLAQRRKQGIRRPTITAIGSTREEKMSSCNSEE